MPDEKTPAPAPSAVEKKTPEQLAAEASAKEAEDARKTLKLFSIIADRKIGMPAPHQFFELVPGANHFDAPLPEPVLARLAELQKAGIVKVDLLDGDGKATPWKPEEKK